MTYWLSAESPHSIYFVFKINSSGRLSGDGELQMPVLAMGSEFLSAPFLADHLRMVAENVKEVKIMGAGHWIVQEQTGQVQKGLMDFFMND